MAIHEDLIKAGLNAKEAHAYLALLELGPATIVAISQKSGLKRTTTYEVIDSLSQKGLVSQTFFGKRKKYVGEPPESFFNLKNRELDAVRNLLPTLRALRNVAIEKPSIQFFQSKEGLKKVFEDMILNTDPINDKLRGIETKPYILVERLGEKFWIELLAKKQRSGLESLTLDTLDEKDLKKFLRRNPWGIQHGVTLKYLRDEKDEFKFSLYLYQNKIAIIAADQMIALVIANQKLKDSLVFIFNVLWANAEISKYKGE